MTASAPNRIIPKEPWNIYKDSHSMKLSHRYIIFIITILIFSSLACGFISTSQNPTTSENDNTEVADKAHS